MGWALSEITQFLLSHNNGLCYNNIITSLSDVGRRYCATMFVNAYATEADAVLYNQTSR